MYVGMALAYLGLAILGGGIVALVLLPVAMLVIQHGVILREEPTSRVSSARTTCATKRLYDAGSETARGTLSLDQRAAGLSTTTGATSGLWGSARAASGRLTGTAVAEVSFASPCGPSRFSSLRNEGCMPPSA